MPVDDRDVGINGCQFLGGEETAESGAQDDNMWHVSSLSKILGISPVAVRSRIIAGLNAHRESCL